MQAPSQSRANAVDVSESLPTLVRMLVALFATATLLFMFRPSVVHAQEPAKPAAKPAEAKAAHPTPAPAKAAPAHAEAAHAAPAKAAAPVHAEAAHAAPAKAAAPVHAEAAHAAPAKAAAPAHAEPAHQPPAKPAAAKPVATPPAAASHAAPANSSVHASATTTGSAQGALAEQTAGKSDAAPKEPVKAAPRAVRPTTTKAAVASTPAPAKAKPDVTHAAVAEHAPAHAAAHAEEVAESEAFAAANLDPVALTPPRIWGPDVMAMRGARGGEQVTVFISHALDERQADIEVDALLPVKVARPRTAEYASAPFAVSAATLTSSGVVGHQEAPVKKGLVARVTSVATKTEPTPRRLQLLDEIEVTLPLGTVAEVGSRFVTVDGNRLFKSTSLIAVPTGVLEVVRVEDSNVVYARVVQQTGSVQEGQRLLPLEGSAILSGAPVTPVKRLSNAPETEVIWVDGDGLLPSLQSYLVLGAGETQGVKIGDQFALVKRFGLGPDAVEQRIALVRVVRVTAYGSSAIVVRQDQPGIGVGSAARLVGRVQ